MNTRTAPVDPAASMSSPAATASAYAALTGEGSGPFSDAT